MDNLNEDDGFFPPPWNIYEFPEKTEGWIEFQKYMKKDPEYYLGSMFTSRQSNDFLKNSVSKILEKRNEIIDLFCKTFIVSQEPKSLEELRALFAMCKLQCKIHSDFHQSFRITLLDNQDMSKNIEQRKEINLRDNVHFTERYPA